MGIAIASMHYIGMDSMRMPALIHYAWSLFALSIVIAVVASIAAIMISRSLRSGPHSLLWSKAGSAVIMGAAIAGMHYVGMAAACYEPVASVEVSELNAPLVGSVSLSTLLIIAGVIFIGTTIALGVQATAEREQALASYRQLAAELELKVAERTSALERVNQELTAFSYSVAHDLRAPLRSLSGFSALLRKSLRDRLTPESERHLAKIHASADRMNELIDGLLALSNISRQQLKPTRVDLGAIARRILADLGAVERDRQVEVRIPDDLVVEGDAALLTSALENLLGNAWKFTRDRPVAKIELGCFTRDDHAVYFVRDNGAGFEMNRAQKLFNAFERLHTAEGYPGTGVGLATTKRIVERHGGSIWAEAKINEGATFFFTLDRSASTPLPVPAQDLSLSR
jgi:signal transduction histidine kinase